MHRHGYSHQTKGPSMRSIARVFLVFTVATLAALLLPIIL
jgi:hypothetical protein